MKLDLLTNATVVDDAIRFVSENFKYKEEQVKSSPSTSSDSSSHEDDKESKEPDYDYDKKEGEEKQEHDTGKITVIKFSDYCCHILNSSK
jgi:NAD+--asparagine ADP-ribosyltransferase